MTETVLAVVLGVLFATGTFLVLRRDVVRVVWGVAIIGQAANVYLVTMGGLEGTAPVFLGHGGDAAGKTDPLVQALVLTAIVIGFGTTAFALVLTYRLYEEHGTIDVDEIAAGGVGSEPGNGGDAAPTVSDGGAAAGSGASAATGSDGGAATGSDGGAATGSDGGPPPGSGGSGAAAGSDDTGAAPGGGGGG